MTHLKTVFAFAWVYMKRYQGRLILGVLLGVLFGLSNASFVWATRTLVERLSPAETKQMTAEVETQPSGGVTLMPAAGSETLRAFEERAESWVDPWLPRADRKPLGWREIVGGLLFLPMLVLARGAAGFLSSYCMAWASERVINDLRVDSMGKLGVLSLDFFDRSRSGDLLTRINTDTGTLHRAMRVGFTDLVKEVVTIISIFTYLMLLDWKLTLFSMVFLPMCLGPLFVLGKKARKASAASINATVLQSSQLVELLAGMRIIKAFNLEKIQLERFKRLSRELVRQGMRGVKAKEMVNPVVEVVSTGAIGILIVYLFATERTMADLVGFLTGLIIFYTPVKRLGSIHIMMEQASVGVMRLKELLSENPTVKEPATPKPWREFAKEISFENVSFAYAQNPVLNDFSLAISRGYKLGVAGPSGSGKSTLVNLIFRFYDPTAGRISMDGIDLREMTTENLRRHMALVSQDVVLFDQTVAENIACGKEERATQEEIESAARSAFAHDFIMRLPNGYDTRIGERGVTLSGGQRQRLAIARAFVRNAPILVLDEATASLDAEAEAEVQRAIDRLSESRTVIAVAHRLATLAAMDGIITLVDGRIAEQGTFEELLRKKGAFSEMARRQGIDRTESGTAS